MGRSSYIVELSVDSGAARAAELSVYPDPATIEAIVLRETKAAMDSLGSPARMLCWVVERGEVVDVLDITTFISVGPGHAPQFQAERFRQRLPPLRGKLVKPAQSVSVSAAMFALRAFASDGPDFSRSYLMEMDGALFYGLNDLELEDRFPQAKKDLLEPSSSGTQAFVLSILKRASVQGDFEDEEYMVEVLWSAPADSTMPMKGQRSGHLLCRDPNDRSLFAVFTQKKKRWVWTSGALATVLDLLPPELIESARAELDLVDGEAQS